MGIVSGIFNAYYFVTKSVETLIYLIYTMKQEGLDNPYCNIDRTKPIAYILGSGPSFRKFLDDYDKDSSQFRDGDFFAVNFFVQDAHFSVIKPRYYVISDPVFFRDSELSDKCREALMALSEKVSWPMILFIPRVYAKSPYLQPILKNRNIEIRSFHSYRYNGLEKWRNWCFNQGWGNGEYGSVVLHGLYSALLLGYEKIFMYGIDHTYFDNLVVDNDNRLCFRDSHYYGTEQKLRPLYDMFEKDIDGNPRHFSMSEYLAGKQLLFSGHELMARYARSLGAEIINCTPGSMVDAYKRLKQ